MSFIKARRLVPSKQGYYTEGTASICESVYVTNKTHHSDQKVIENLGSVIYLSEDKKSGIFNSPTRGIVFYDSTNDSFQELSEDDPRLKEASIVPFTKRHVVFGDVYLFVEFLKKMELTGVFRECFLQRRDFQRVILHLAHSVLRDGSHISCDNFYQKSFISYLGNRVRPSSLKTDSDYFAMMGDDNIKVGFFKVFAKYMKKKDPNFGKASYVDSTPLPNDEMDNPFNALCSHGLSATSVQMRLVLVLDQSNGLPIWYDIIPGNILDISTIDKIRDDVKKTLHIEIDDLVLDAGYVTKDLIKVCHNGTGKTFTARMPAKNGYPYKTLYYELKNEIHRGKYQFIRNGYTYFGAKKEKTIFNEQIFTYTYVDHYNASKGFKKFLENHEDRFEEMKDKDKDFAMISAGYFVLVSNIDTNPKDMLVRYYGRTEIEKVFKTAKEYLELLPLNKWTNDTVRGKILNDIIGTIIVLLMRKELRDSKKSIPDMIGATQSLMCVRDDDYNVTIDTANKQTRETFEAFHIPVPAHLDARVYWTTISGK